MKILALEFSSHERSVAVIRRSPNGSLSVHEALESGGRAHAFAMIETVLQQAGIEREEIDSLAVGLGPGSYTGIRMTISLAQGWQLARNVQLIGISSVDCLFKQAVADGIIGNVRAVIDAQRGEFYVADAELTLGQAVLSTPLHLASRADVNKDTNVLLIGPEVTEQISRGKIICPRAATVGLLALDRTDFVSGEKLEPIYLREPQFVKAPPPRILPLPLGDGRGEGN